MKRETLRVGGFQPFTSIDYPGQLAAVVFCQGCPWRCQYCHNTELIEAKPQGEFEWDTLLDWLTTRRGLLDAVVFSGGEPTLQASLAEAIKAVKSLGFKIGLHTAGIYPERLKTILSLLDWVGLDIKALPHSYPDITGVPFSGEKAWEAARILAQSNVPHELRLTWDQTLLDEGEIANVRQQLAAFTRTELKVQTCNDYQKSGL